MKKLKSFLTGIFWSENMDRLDEREGGP